VQSHNAKGEIIQHFLTIKDVYNGSTADFVINDSYDGRIKLLSAYRNQWGSDPKHVIMSIRLYDLNPPKG
jgi:hypothetical protein